MNKINKINEIINKSHLNNFYLNLFIKINKKNVNYKSNDEIFFINTIVKIIFIIN